MKKRRIFGGEDGGWKMEDSLEIVLWAIPFSIFHLPSSFRPCAFAPLR
jgi:hypothetical protein